MKKYHVLSVVFGLLCLSSCTSIEAPSFFDYKVIETDIFPIASWQKVTDKHSEFHVYIEGDGYAYNAHGRPSSNPTPRGTLVRTLAFSDSSPNVIYLARPCQFVQNKYCHSKYWTTARFSAPVIESTAQALKAIVGTSDVVLIGFSGGAQVAGLVAVMDH